MLAGLTVFGALTMQFTLPTYPTYQNSEGIVESNQQYMDYLYKIFQPVCYPQYSLWDIITLPFK
jgi:hypothetical protein